MGYRFPFMVVAQISRDSIQRSAEHGITAAQILNYLRSSAHQTCRKNLHVVPQVVTDNITLWCQERTRLSFGEGVLYSQFESLTDFERLREYAVELNALMWEPPAAFDEDGSDIRPCLMVVSPESHDKIKKYW